MPKKASKYTITTLLLAAVIVLLAFQSYQLYQLGGAMENMQIRVSMPATVSATTATAEQGITPQSILAEISPTGTPAYGEAAGVSYDAVEAGLQTLVGYEQSIELNDAEFERYKQVANSPGTSCEYCCPIGADTGFGKPDGTLACGCSHNIAFGGLTRWLIKNTDYSNSQIIEEIGRWKILFFPQGSVEKEIANRGINPTAVGLPAMTGGC